MLPPGGLKEQHRLLTVPEHWTTLNALLSHFPGYQTVLNIRHANQWVGESVCLAISQLSVSHLIRQRVKQARKQAGKQELRQSVSQSGRQAICQSAKQSVSQSVSQSASQSDREAGKPAGMQAGRQAGTQPASQPASLSFTQWSINYAISIYLC